MYEWDCKYVEYGAACLCCLRNKPFIAHESSVYPLLVGSIVIACDTLDKSQAMGTEKEKRDRYTTLVFFCSFDT